MKKLLAIVLTVAVLAMGLGAGIASAGEGINPGSPEEFTTSVTAGCTPAAQPGTILLLDNTSGEGAAALTAFTYTYTPVTPAGFAAVNLALYDIIYVAWSPSQAMVDALNARSADLETWIKYYGGGIVVNAEFKNPGPPTNPYSFLPVTYDTDADWDHLDGVNIVDPTHPLVSGLTSAQLDNWGNSVHGEITVYPAAATIVSVATGLGNSPHITGMSYGGGKIVVVASDPEYHVGSYGGCQLLSNELSWAAVTGSIEVDIDIKPWSDPNSINVNKKKGVTPVAILGSDTFDVTMVDVTTLRFGQTGNEASPAHDLTDPATYADHLVQPWLYSYGPDGVLGGGDDVYYTANEDAYVDLVSHYRTQDTDLVPGDTEAILTGQTIGGVPIEGTDSVRTVPPGP